MWFYSFNQWCRIELRNQFRETSASGFCFEVFIIPSACLCMCIYKEKCVRESLKLTRPHSIHFVSNVKASRRAHTHLQCNTITIFPQIRFSSELPLFPACPWGFMEKKRKKKKVQSCVTALNTKPHTGLPGCMTHILLCACVTTHKSVYVCVH